LNSLIKTNAQIYISTVTITELYSYQNLDETGTQAIEKVLDLLVLVPVDVVLARLAGNVRRQYRLKTPDSLIAATAISTRTQLVTRNVMDFQNIPNLAIQKI
jgi:predicted nucleic acid-binding protein